MKDSTLVLPMTSRDLALVTEAQKLAYSDDFQESRESFVAKLKRFPSGCFSAITNGTTFSGYLFSFPTKKSCVPPKLDSADLSDFAPADADCYYLHDCCVLRQGQGIGSKFVEHVVEVCRRLGYTEIYLVAVQGSVPFWHKMGFDIVEDVSEFGAGAKALASYGADARLMCRDLSAYLL